MSLPQSSFGAVCHLVNGKAFKPSDWSETGVPIVRIQNLNDSTKPFNYWAGGMEKQVPVTTGDLLLAWSGTPGTSFGAHIWSGPNGVLNQHIFRCDLDDKKVTKEWARSAVNHRLHRLIAQAHGGVGLQHVTRGMVEDLEIPLPPLSEQRRIIGILNRADALRAKRRSAIAHLDELTQAIFDDLIGGGDSKWPVVDLTDAYWFQEGPGVRKWQFQSEGVKLLNVGNIEKTGVLNLSKTDRHLSEAEAMGKYRHFLIDEGDLVIASSGISFDVDGMLRTRGAFVFREHLPLCLNTSTIRFKSIEKVSDLRFLWAWIGSREFRSQITKLVTGSAQQNFGPSHLSRLKITLPPISVQKAFADKVAQIDASKKSMGSAILLTDSLFTSLQDRAFRGAL